MDVVLKVLKGSKAGTKIAIKKDEFLIGRSPSCHLCAGSTSISRKHCVIRRDGAKWTIKDLGSRNGTIINGKKIAEEVELNSGDEIVLGTLQFLFTITPGINNQKKPQVKSVADAVERSASKSSGSSIIQEEDITQWLLDTTAPSEAANETQTITFDDTKAGKLKDDAPDLVEGTTDADEAGEVTSDSKADAAERDASDSAAGKSGKGKKQPGKLPPVPNKPGAKDSREAAVEALRAWNRRR